MARPRGNGEGSIYQRKSDGKWCTAMTLPTGKRKVLYGRTRQEVAKKLNAALQAREHGVPIAPERLTVGAFLERWLEESARPKVRPRTFESYAMVVRRHLIPCLGRLKLSQLAPQDVQAYLNQKQKQPGLSKRAAGGLSARTDQYHRAILRRALSQALRWGLVSRNVATLVDPPRSKRHEIKPLDPEQAKVFYAAVRDHRLEALYTVALAMGLRQGEALGLRWEDVDLERGTLTVLKQVQRIEGTLQLVDVKTDRSRRTIVLPVFAVVALREHRKRQLEERFLAGSRWKEWGLVFPSSIGTPMDASNVIHQYHRILDRAGLPKARFHDLRHTCATLLLLHGEDLRVVMEVLGHSQISLTANTYQHVLPTLKRQAAARMDALFGTGS